MGRLLVALACVLLLAGCSGGGQAAATNGLAGRWTTVNMVPGSGTDLTMDVAGSSVTGTGDYRIEAGRGGTIQVSGTVNGLQFTLNLAYDTGTNSSYHGVLVGTNQISGTIQPAGAPPYTMTMVRQ